MAALMVALMVEMRDNYSAERMVGLLVVLKAENLVLVWVEQMVDEMVA